MKTTVRTTKHVDAAGALEGATRRYMLDGAQRGVNVAREEAPTGATGFLANQAMVDPYVENDGSVVFGNNAPYAEPVEDGSVPHWIPLRAMDGLRRWAGRILGDRGAAWGVRQKIAEEGTDAQPFMSKGADAAREWFAAHGLDAYVEERI